VGVEGVILLKEVGFSMVFSGFFILFIVNIENNRIEYLVFD